MIRQIIGCALLALGSLTISGSASGPLSPYCAALTDEAPLEIWSYEEIEAEFLQLDQYLQEKVPSSDAEANLAAAEKYRKEQSAGWLDWSAGTFNDKREKALFAFVQLPFALNKSRCTQSSVRQLLKNIIPIKCRSHNKPDQRSRLEQIVYEFAEQHAKLCGPKYMQSFEQKYAALDSETKAIVAGLFTPEVENKILAHIAHPLEHTTILNAGMDWTMIELVPFEDILENIKRHFTFPGRKVNNLAGANAADSSAAKSLPSQEKLGPNIVDEYVIKPCRKYKRTLVDVFKPARLDMLFLEQDKWMTKEAEDSFETSELFKSAWHNFRMCELLLSVEHDDELRERFREIAYPK